jgi:hypothetical protein
VVRKAAAGFGGAIRLRAQTPRTRKNSSTALQPFHTTSLGGSGSPSPCHAVCPTQALEEQRYSHLAYLKRTEPSKYTSVLEQCFTINELRFLADNKWRK